MAHNGVLLLRWEIGVSRMKQVNYKIVLKRSHIGTVGNKRKRSRKETDFCNSFSHFHFLYLKKFIEYENQLKSRFIMTNIITIIYTCPQTNDLSHIDKENFPKDIQIKIILLHSDLLYYSVKRLCAQINSFSIMSLFSF